MKKLSNIFCALGVIMIGIGGLLDPDTAAAWLDDMLEKRGKV